MTRTFMPNISSLEELTDIQLDGLRWTVRHAYENSPFYRRRLQKAGITPEDINSLADLISLPFTTADDLREGYPFPLRAVDFDRIVRIHASSGTTGKRKVLCYTQQDIDDWANMFARCYEMAGVSAEDRVQIAVGYGLWTAGVGFQLGCERLGAMAVPVGPGNTEMHCEMLVDMQSTVFCATASMALLMGEEVQRRNLIKQIALRKVILGAERHSESMDRRIKELLGVEHVFDIPGLTELYGPGTGLDCSEHRGIHYWADYYILEIIDPETLEPVVPGELGEMVVTTLRKEGAPLIRYRTRDLTRIIPQPCPCGNPLPMHDRILGRSDDMFIVRAVNIYPGQIDHVLSQVPEIGSEFQVHLERREDGRDYLILKVERRPRFKADRNETIASRITQDVRKHILVSAEVEVLDHGSLPRTERKSKRVFDHRD
ncbi:MAG: phenylacetate--CoA ligase [Deltaproteobacteria bacterium]|nr:MAG: phenylacetate--CoA ligase [Deltaproteobacteria bacterium]